MLQTALMLQSLQLNRLNYVASIAATQLMNAFLRAYFLTFPLRKFYCALLLFFFFVFISQLQIICNIKRWFIRHISFCLTTILRAAVYIYVYILCMYIQSAVIFCCCTHYNLFPIHLQLIFTDFPGASFSCAAFN